MSKITSEEKRILDNFKKSIPKLTEDERNRVLIFSEAVALIADRSCPIGSKRVTA